MRASETVVMRSARTRPVRRTRRAAARLGRLPEALQPWVRLVESWLCHDSVLLYVYLLADPSPCPWPEPWPVGTKNQRTTSTSTHRRLNSTSVNRALVAHLRLVYRASSSRLRGACLHQVRGRRGSQPRGWRAAMPVTGGGTLAWRQRPPDGRSGDGLSSARDEFLHGSGGIAEFRPHR